MSHLRVVHATQQGARLSWNDSLFQQVESVPPAPIEALPAPEVSEIEWPVLMDAVDQGRGPQ